ncbi:threonine aldolase family protein [Komagataeibacter melomenusus]
MMTCNMDFSSDNRMGVNPEILEALHAANKGPAGAYGHDDMTRSLDQVVGDFFGTKVSAFPIISGTAANCLPIAASTPPYGGIACSEGAHILRAECGAPEFFTNGSKMLPVAAQSGKMTADALAALLAAYPASNTDTTVPAVLSLTQVTERGTVYTLDEIAALTRLAHERGMTVHMDGARFANALVTLGCTPADMSWRAGVDVLSLGTSKNGTICGEAVVFFNPDRAENFRRYVKRAGHMMAKQRFVSAQVVAHLANDLWRHNARNANAVARRLHDGLARQEQVTILHKVEANIMFVALPAACVQALRAQGFAFHTVGQDAVGQPVVRFVTSFLTTEGDVDHLLAAISKACA